VLYLIRSPKVAQVEELYQRVNAIADGAALMTGTRVEKDFIKACSNLVPNNVLEKLLYQNLTGIACPEYTDEEKAFAARIVDTYENKSDPKGLLVKMFGRGILEALADKLDGRPLNDFVLPYRSTETSMAGSTDVGDVSWICPTSQFLAVTTAMGTPGHSWQFVACNNTSIAHKGVLYAGKVLAGTAIDLLEDGSLVKAAKEELHRRLAPEGGRYVCPIPPGIKPRAIAPGD
jgi:aminobenzoyl-glutamate utilization protein B